MTRYDYIIVGGGISGLSVAYNLKKKQKNFILLEKSNRLGGVIQSEKIDGFQIEKGANTVLIRNQETFLIFKDIGILEKLKLPNSSAKKRYILNNQKLIPLPTGPFSTFFHPITPLSRLIKWSFKDYFSQPIQADVTIKNFFTNRFDFFFYENLIFPMVSGIYAGNPDIMSLEYNFPKIFQYVKEYGSIIKGFQKSPRNHIPDEAKPYWNKMFSFDDGLETIIQHLEINLKGLIQKNQSVKQIEPYEGYWKVFTENQILETYQLILSVPAPTTALFLKGIEDELSQQLIGIQYVPLIVLHFTFPTAIWKRPLNGFGFLRSEKENTSILGCIFNSRIFDHVAPKGYELITVMIGGATQPDLVNEKIEKLVYKIQKEIKIILNLQKKPDLLHSQKWEMAIPEYTMLYHNLEKSLLKFYKRFSNIKILSNFWGGIGVPDCIQKGLSV